MLAGTTLKGICLLEFTDTGRIDMQFNALKNFYQSEIKAGRAPLLILLKQQLDDYFNHQLQYFTVPLDIKGTAFQQQAWHALLDIPYAQTRNYQQQAKSMNNPKAARAVGNANRKNRISILIPCHRVIAKNGEMAGYGGEIWRKKYLINLEKNHQLLI